MTSEDFPSATLSWVDGNLAKNYRNARTMWNDMPAAARPPSGITQMGKLYKYFTKRKLENSAQRDTYDPATERFVKGGSLLYPFRTKVEAYKEKNKTDEEIPEYVKDYSIKVLANKYKKPNYSPARNAYEMDIMFTEGRRNNTYSKLYLVLININTRYLIVIPIKDKSKAEIQRALAIAREEVQIDSIKGDGERGFNASQTKSIIESSKDQKCHFDSSPYTFHNKHVDSVIRTIRNAAGLSNEILEDEDLVQQIVEYYNNTPHSGLPVGFDGIHYTPNEMMDDPDLEWAYIRQKDRELAEAQWELQRNGYGSYSPGNVLLLHLDHGKTDKKFKKRRRNFQDIGIFINYEHGNVKCQLINKNKNGKVITVPIFYTKRIATGMDKLADKYKRLFNLK